VEEVRVYHAFYGLPVLIEIPPEIVAYLKDKQKNLSEYEFFTMTLKKTRTYTVSVVLKKSRVSLDFSSNLRFEFFQRIELSSFEEDEVCFTPQFREYWHFFKEEILKVMKPQDREKFESLATLYEAVR